jgi:phosphinothricin acetyltransferase
VTSDDRASVAVSVRRVAASDAEEIARIYNYYVAETIVTFEEEPVAAAEIARRIGEVAETRLPWLVAERAGAVVGYAYATRWRPRRGYRFSSEVTVYVAPEECGRGIGTTLYAALLESLRASGDVHAAMGGIALPNDASIALHEKFGFRKVAHFEHAGCKFGRWIDVGYWQVVLPEGGGAGLRTDRPGSKP